MPNQFDSKIQVENVIGQVSIVFTEYVKLKIPTIDSWGP